MKMPFFMLKPFYLLLNNKRRKLLNKKLSNVVHDFKSC